ncbi:MAG: TetR/AcrR family transcriptional regulator [Kiloniellales bacterium]
MALAADKHAQILDGAVQAFQEDGFAGTSMDRVAQRAGVSKRTIYNHFESKEVLFRAILDVMVEKVRQAVSLTYDPARPVDQQLLELGWTEGRLFVDPDFMRMARMVIGETMRDPVLAEEMNKRMEYKAVFNAFMEAANKHGALVAPDPALAADQFIGLLKTRGFWPVVFSGQPVTPAQMGEIVQDAVKIFLNTYRVQSS